MSFWAAVEEGFAQSWEDEEDFSEIFGRGVDAQESSV